MPISEPSSGKDWQLGPTNGNYWAMMVTMDHIASVASSCIIDHWLDCERPTGYLLADVCVNFLHKMSLKSARALFLQAVVQLSCIDWRDGHVVEPRQMATASLIASTNSRIGPPPAWWDSTAFESCFVNFTRAFTITTFTTIITDLNLTVNRAGASYGLWMVLHAKQSDYCVPSSPSAGFRVG